jgi:hypothetical protein
MFLLRDFISTLHPGVTSLQEELEARCRQQYGNALRHQGLRPYVGHRDDLALIGSFDRTNVMESAASFSMSLPPDSLQQDLVLLRDWAEDMAGPGGQRTSLVSGLLQFNYEILRSTLLPIVCKAYAGYMSKLASSLITSIKDLRQRIEKYIAVLKERPADLDSFVQFIEDTYQHLDDDGDLRLAVMTSKEQISTLYEILRSAVPQAAGTFDDRLPSAGRSKISATPPFSLTSSETSQTRQQQDAASIAALSAATDGMIGAGGGINVTTVTARDARPVFQQWKQAQADISRYHDECLAAREFYESSSTLMASHLKTNIAKMETEASCILNELRMGKSTTSTLSPAEARNELARLNQNLVSLRFQLDKFHAWMKLFGNQPGIKNILLDTESMVVLASSHLESRTTFWKAAIQWEHALDSLYSRHCFQRAATDYLPADGSDGEVEDGRRGSSGSFGSLVDCLESSMAGIDKEVANLSAKHVDGDIKNASTVTPLESSLAARFAVVVKSWKGMLPYAKALSQPG